MHSDEKPGIHTYEAILVLALVVKMSWLRRISRQTWCVVGKVHHSEHSNYGRVIYDVMIMFRACRLHLVSVHDDFK